MAMQLEICANSATSCRQAELGGATRVELCAGIPEGGTTPSAGEMAVARSLIAIPIHVIIRPRARDFVYSSEEIEAMCYDIRVARSLGMEGVVFGCLTPEGGYDEEANSRLLKEAQGMQLTFHRAFDVCAAPFEMLEKLIAAGFHRVLTSGCAPTALEGKDMIGALNKQAAGRIGIMAGCGIRLGNIETLARHTGITQFHSSLRHDIPSSMRFRRPEVSMGGTVKIDEYSRPETSADMVRQAVDILQGI